MKKSAANSTLFLLALCSGMFFSCRKTGHSSTQIVFDSIVVKERIPLLEKNDTTLPYADLKVNFVYPAKFGNKEALTRLQQIFIGTVFNDTRLDNLTPREATDSYTERYREEYKSLSNDYYSDKNRLPKGEIPQWYWYSLYNSNRIEFQNDSLLSYAVEYSDYTGGAHGSYRLTYVNIDLGNLVTLSEEDIFAPDYYKPLSEIIAAKLAEKYGVPSPDSLINKGFVDIREIEPNDNFRLTPEGIQYTYNQYEIAPYSMGVIDLFIPYAELKEILKPDNILQRLFPEAMEMP